MPFDGSAWDESDPTNADLANEIDDFMRDIKIAIRSRVAREHAWPSSQVTTGESGWHTFVTLSGQTAAPSFVVGTNTQLAAVWCSSGSKNILVTDSAGINTILLYSGKAINVVSGVYSATGTLGEMVIGSSGGQFKILAPGSSGQVLTASTTADIIWSSVGSLLGTFSARSFSTTYQATSDGFVVGNTTATSASHSYTAYQDANATPTTVIQLGSAVWVSGGQPIDIPVAFPVKKNNYYSVVASGAGGTLQFIPIGA